MSDNSKIEWTDATWNPITGCSVVSPGCTNCYAMKLAGTRMKHHPTRVGLTIDTKAGPVWNGQVRFNASMLLQPLRWKRPRNIFVCAHGDLFHEHIPTPWIDQVFSVMALAPQHTFQVLTKRPERMLNYLTCQRSDGTGNAARYMAAAYGAYSPDKAERDATFDRVLNGPWPLPNILLGVSVEDQNRADERRDHIAPLARKHGWRTFVSYEPALGPVDWIGWEFLSWMISGGESQRGSRPSHPDWHRASRDFCAAHNIPYLFKQWGDWVPVGQALAADDAIWNATKHPYVVFDDDGTAKKPPCNWPDGTQAGLVRIGKKKAGRLLDGIEHNGMPEARS